MNIKRKEIIYLSKEAMVLKLDLSIISNFILILSMILINELFNFLNHFQMIKPVYYQNYPHNNTF